MGTSNAADLRAVYDLYSSSEGMSISDAVQAFGVENAAKLFEGRDKARATLTFEEFSLLAAAHQLPSSSLAEAFKLMDRDGDGRISKEELLAVVQSGWGSAQRPGASTGAATGTAAAKEPQSGMSTSISTAGAAAASAGALQPLLAKYFGAQGTQQVSFSQFGSLMRDLHHALLAYKWESLRPDAHNTCSLASFAQLILRHTAHDLPPVMAKALASMKDEELATRLTFNDFVKFYEVLDNLEELEALLEEQMGSGSNATLSREAFARCVESVSTRREVASCSSIPGSTAPTTSSKQQQSSGGSNTAADTTKSGTTTSGTTTAGTAAVPGGAVPLILFSWLDADRNGELSRKEVRQLLPVLAATAALPQTPRKLALWENIVLGGTSAGIAGAAVFPLDTVKSRMMNGQGTSIVGAFSEVIRKQGPLGLYRGLPAQLVGIMPEKALKLTLYNTLRQAMMDPKTQKASYSSEALAGLGTACVQVVVTQPYELVKLRQQTVAGEPLSQTLRELGFRGLTKGTSATLLRDVPFNMLYFTSYAALKDVIHDKYEPDSPLLSPGGLMAAGLGAGLVAGGLTTPFDVIKTRMQADKTGRYSGLLDCIRQIHAEGGSRAFLRGLGPRLMLIPPLFALTFTCFETLQRLWFPQTVPAPNVVDPWHISRRHTLTEIVQARLRHLQTLAE